jgi:hypothetical protein
MAGRGLSTADLDQIRQVLAGGKRPRVMFTDAAGQIAGQIGQVVALEDPKSSDEWIVVKFGGDALPFSPADLQMPPKGGAPAKKTAPAKAAEPAVTPSGRKPLAIGEDLVQRDRKADTKAAAPAAGAQTGGTAPADRTVARQEPTVSETPSAPAESLAPAPRKPAGRAPKVKPPAGLTVTLAYTEGEWTVAAMQGSKSLAKPYVIKPAEALKMVGLLDVPGVQEAVESILSTERDAAKAQADKLRAELAEVEAKLAELGI